MVEYIFNKKIHLFHEAKSLISFLIETDSGQSICFFPESKNVIQIIGLQHFSNLW